MVAISDRLAPPAMRRRMRRRHGQEPLMVFGKHPRKAANSCGGSETARSSLAEEMADSEKESTPVLRAGNRRLDACVPPAC